MIKQFEIVPVTEANRRLKADGYTCLWDRMSDHQERKTGYVLYYRAESHDGHWYRTMTQAKMKRQELVQERLRKDMERARHDKQDD